MSNLAKDWSLSNKSYVWKISCKNYKEWYNRGNYILLIGQKNHIYYNIIPLFDWPLNKKYQFSRTNFGSLYENNDNLEPSILSLAFSIITQICETMLFQKRAWCKRISYHLNFPFHSFKMGLLWWSPSIKWMNEIYFTGFL